MLLSTGLSVWWQGVEENIFVHDKNLKSVYPYRGFLSMGIMNGRIFASITLISLQEYMYFEKILNMITFLHYNDTTTGSHHNSHSYHVFYMKHLQMRKKQAFRILAIIYRKSVSICRYIYIYFF